MSDYRKVSGPRSRHGRQGNAHSRGEGQRLERVRRPDVAPDRSGMRSAAEPCGP